MNQKRIVLAGGSGFLGQALAKELLASDYEVVVLTRSPREREAMASGKLNGMARTPAIGYNTSMARKRW